LEGVAGRIGPSGGDEITAPLLRELVAHLRQNRTQLREEWARRITEAKLLTAMTREEIFAEATSVYDNYVEVLETGAVEALQAYARNLSERIIPRGVETDEVVGIVLLLRDVLARSLFAKYQTDFQLLNRILDAYEPAANRIANTVAVGFVQERERIIRQQQEAIRELSTPVLQVRERLLILPIIGVIDPQRAAIHSAFPLQVFPYRQFRDSPDCFPRPIRYCDPMWERLRRNAHDRALLRHILTRITPQQDSLTGYIA
jgi:rsbT co-antagonist protein RsbR